MAMKLSAAIVFLTVGTAALAVSETCITDGWPVADRSVQDYAVSETPISLGSATETSSALAVELNRRTVDISDGGDIDARPFTPGLFIMLK